MEIRLTTNSTWSEPTQYMINHGAKLAIHRKEIVITDNDKLTISHYSKTFWVMNDNTEEELKAGGSVIDIPHELRDEFLEAMQSLIK